MGVTEETDRDSEQSIATATCNVHYTNMDMRVNIGMASRCSHANRLLAILS